jgi:predicted negative regulator of RcsB-dependent stress response
LAILIGLVIATIIITGVFVGYHAWQESLHEEAETHSEPIHFEIFQIDVINQPTFHIQTDLNSLIR